MQVSSLTSAFSVTILIASTGHADTQAAQPVHVALSTFTTIMVLPRCTPDASFPIYLLPLGNDPEKSKIAAIICLNLFWFVLFYFLVRSFPTQREKQVHDTQLKSKNNKEIHKRDHNRSWDKPVRKGNGSKERDEHPY